MFSKLFHHKKLKAVEFNAVMPDGSTKKTCFALGLGPCGKVVTKLSEYQSEFAYCITQTTDDGEVKEFWYGYNALVGRFVRTYQ